MKKLSYTTRCKIVENNKKISKLLLENEKLYLTELNDFERRIYPVDSNKIEIPLGYVRKKDDFIESYNIKSITDRYQHQSNIAYLMQYADLKQYLGSRFYLFGQIEKVGIYYDVINLVSILEVVLKELSEKYRNQCKNCNSKTSKMCNLRINTKTNGNLKLLLNALNDLQIINLQEQDLKNLQDLIDLRNKVHLRLMESTLYNNEQLCTENYNMYMISFKKMMQSINLDKTTCRK